MGLPPELLLQIVEGLSSSHLIRLVQACHSFHALFVPILYRTVDLKSPQQVHDVLTLLEEKIHLSAYVHVLRVRPVHFRQLGLKRDKESTVLDETWASRCIERIAMVGVGLEENSEAKGFSCLREFDWDGWDLPGEGVWKALKLGCPKLTSLAVTVDKYGFNPASSLFDFEGLTSFCIRARSDIMEVVSVARPLPLPPRLWQMLLYRCPDLESLEFISFLPSTYRFWFFDPVYLGTWRKLRKLTLGCFIHRNVPESSPPPDLRGDDNGDGDGVGINHGGERMMLTVATAETSISAVRALAGPVIGSRLGASGDGTEDIDESDDGGDGSDGEEDELFLPGHDRIGDCEAFFLRHPYIEELRLGWNPHLLQSTFPLPLSAPTASSSTLPYTSLRALYPRHILPYQDLTSFIGTHGQLGRFPIEVLARLREVRLDREHPYALLSATYIDEICKVLRKLTGLRKFGILVVKVQEKDQRQMEALRELLRSVGLVGRGRGSEGEEMHYRDGEEDGHPEDGHGRGLEELDLTCIGTIGESTFQAFYSFITTNNLPNLRSFAFSYQGLQDRFLAATLSTSIRRGLESLKISSNSDLNASTASTTGVTPTATPRPSSQSSSTSSLARTAPVLDNAKAIFHAHTRLRKIKISRFSSSSSSLKHSGVYELLGDSGEDTVRGAGKVLVGHEWGSGSGFVGEDRWFRERFARVTNNRVKDGS
ncbi:hypothetical protein D9758_015625 [Tetrapyrgos nigripes]|uniref:F-box domain-containing protein n=1 Tax=Tetrapyrgos nigripes TaxID=182062 RepID=A0A8H5FN77_9AGAR|nr:hypothetical protein D9758_015625 [Tetrapyrgos nigripes]